MVFPSADDVNTFMNSIVHLDKWGDLTKNNVLRSTAGKKLQHPHQLLLIESHEIVVDEHAKMDIVVNMLSFLKLLFALKEQFPRSNCNIAER